MRPLRFGIKTAAQHMTYKDVLPIWQAADAMPVFEHAWVNDHFAAIVGDINGPCLESWTLLTALGAKTERIRVGVMVTGNTFRHPAVLARIATTLDQITDGRVDIGIGAGWHEYEHASIGIPLYGPKERIERLNEACAIIKLLFTQHLTDFDGRYYQLTEARCDPKPVQQPHPPLLLGGSGEQRTLRVVATHANIWNYVAGTVDVFQHKVQVLHQHCATIGRDPQSIELSVQLMMNYADLAASATVLQQFVDAGATHLILNLDPPYPNNIIARLAEKVVPQIHAPTS